MTKKGLTIFSLTNSDYLSGAYSNRAGGSERQLLYTALATSSLGVNVEIVTVNLKDGASPILGGIKVRNLWSQGTNKLSKMFLLVRCLIKSRNVVYIRGISPVHVVIILLSRLFCRKVMLGLTSDVQCVRGESLFGNSVKILAIRWASKVIAQTKNQYELIDNDFGKQSIIFYNVINSELFDCTEPAQEFRDRNIDVLWMGTIEPKKALERLLDLADHMPQKQFTVMGGPSIESVDYASNIIAEIQKRPNIRFEGFVQPSEIGPFLASAKVLINTSAPLISTLTKEGFPNVFLEAWLFGTPVISMSSDLDGMITRLRLGSFCTTIQEAQEEIVTLTEDNRHWEIMSKNSKDFAFSRDVSNYEVQKRLIDILEV